MSHDGQLPEAEEATGGRQPRGFGRRRRWTCAPLPSSFIPMLRPRFSRKLNPVPIPIVSSLQFPASNLLGGRHTSKRTAKKADHMNMGAESPYPSRQAGTAHPPFSSSSFSSKSEPEKNVATMLKIKEDHPGASAAVQGTIGLVFGQHDTTEFLSRALASIRAEMEALLSDLKLDGEAERIIDTTQSGTLTVTVLDLLDVGDGAVDSAGSAAALAAPSSFSSSFSSSPSTSSSSSSSSSSSVAAAPMARKKGT
jgi:hypothetical protein